MTKFLLDSGDPEEYKEATEFFKQNNVQLWGSTTNPSLIAKKLSGKKINQKEAFELQKEIVLEILDLVEGAVSAEVYADENTKSVEMIQQGLDIATWNKRVVIKLPTTREGFKARTELRKQKVAINNTLVFSQEQSFAICLHEKILQQQCGPITDTYPPFISPFVGRLDDQNEDGMKFVENAMKTKETYGYNLWMLEASVRRPEHIKRGIEIQTELITAPKKAYEEWFLLTQQQREAIDTTAYTKTLSPKPYWQPSEELLQIKTIDEFMKTITSSTLNIQHPLTDKGLTRFAQDWKAIIA